MKIAVVILNWNGRKMLEQFLPSVVENTNTDSACIVVADNKSTDDSISFLQQKFPTIQIIELEQNFGFAEGYNRALQKIDAEYFVLLNSDVEVCENWLEPLVSYMDANTDVAACMPKILSQTRKEYFEHAGASGGFIDKYGYPFCRGRILSNIETDENQYNTPIDVFWTTGACMLVRANVYRALGGLDADFFAHMEEIDFCWRAKHLGYRLVCLPQSKVFHVGGGTLKTESPRKLYLNYRNNLFMLYKNLPTKKFKRTILKRMILDGFSAMIYLFSFRFSFFASVFKAHCDFYKSIKELKPKRKEILLKSTVVRVPNIYRHSIVLKFFKAKKRLKFSDIEQDF